LYSKFLERIGKIPYKFRHPPSYILFDVCTVLASFFLFDLLENPKILFIGVPFVYLFFCISIFFKQYDEGYVTGLAIFKERHRCILVYVTIFSMTVGGIASGFFYLLFSRETEGGLFIIFIFAFMSIYPLIFLLFPLRRAVTNCSGYEYNLTRRQLYILRLVTGIGIWLMNIYLETIYFIVLRQTAGEAAGKIPFPYNITFFVFAIMLLVALYMPARVHYFIEFPGDRANMISFAVMIALIALYTLFGLDLIWIL
jgi:hypothetical protein